MTTNFYRYLLRVGGFGAVQSWDASEFLKNDAATAPAYRIIYLARKEK